MLAYTQGGASTPQGATATMENVLGNSTNSAFQSAVQAQNVRNAQAQIQLTGAQIDNTEADAAYKRQLTTTEILKSPYYKLQDKVALSQMAVNNASAEQAYENAKNLKERTISEQLGAPYGTFGSGQAARFGYHLGNSAAQLYKDYKGK
jgi:CHASE2 domain-containing sensor protein